MKKNQLVIGMLLIVGMMLCLTGCSNAPSDSLIKKVYLSEYKTGTFVDPELTPAALVSYKIIGTELTSNEQETFYNVTVEGIFHKTLTEDEIKSLNKRGKGNAFKTYDSVDRIKITFVKRRGEWFNEMEKYPTHIKQEFGR